MKLSDAEIDHIDKIIGSDNSDTNKKRRNDFSAMVATAVIMYGGDRVANMLRAAADVVEAQDDGLHEAYKMRKEVIGDLGQL